MRVVVQRVSEASVSIDGRVAGAIGTGLAVLVGFAPGDEAAAASWMARKVAGLRLFADEAGRMNRSLEDVGGSVLVVSQFTLYGDARRGRRPSFVRAARPETAIPLYEAFLDELRRILPGRVESGRFGADMQVALACDGPVTLLVER